MTSDITHHFTRVTSHVTSFILIPLASLQRSRQPAASGGGGGLVAGGVGGGRGGGWGRLPMRFVLQRRHLS
jgi:uncharacterized membrane protein